MFHEKPTFYFSPVDGHLCYGDLKTLGDVQELHIKSPVTGMIKELFNSCTKTYRLMLFKKIPHNCTHSTEDLKLTRTDDLDQPGNHFLLDGTLL